MRIAIFDFDGTVYKKETFRLLMNHLKNHPHYKNRYRSFFQSVAPRYICSKLNLYPSEKMRHHSMQAYVAALDRLSKQEVERFFSEVANHMRSSFNEKVVKKIRHHHHKGDFLLLVSGAFHPLLNQFQDDLKFDQIIGTNIPFLKDEVNKTERIEHIQGKKKVEKIFETVRNKDIDWEKSYAYADSFSDLPVLNLVGNPVAVNPDQKLLNIAMINSWKVL